MAVRVFPFAAWTLLGGAVTYALLELFGLAGLALTVSVVVAGLLARRFRPDGRTETLGLAAGPGILFIVLGETGDAPGLGGIGVAILAATVAVYFGLRRRHHVNAA
jgi:hypothetical protein